MGNFVFPIAKGRFVEKYMLLQGTDNILIVLLQSSGLQTDTTLAANATLGAIVGANTEAAFTNYGRIVLSSSNISIAVTTTAVVSLTANQVWTAAGGAVNNSVGALITCYRQTSSTPDSGVIPLTKHDFVVTTTGGNLTATVTTVATAS